MMAIFSDYLEQFVEVFIDDFSVFGNSYKEWMANLERMLKRWEETNLILN